MGTIWSKETGANDSPTDGTMEPGVRAAKKRATSEEDETEAKKRKTGAPEKGLEALRQKYKLLEKKRAKARLEEEDISDLQQEKQLKAEIRDLQEEHPAIRGFCDLNENVNHNNRAAIEVVAGFLDPVSLFHWGRVMDSYCAPPTKESQNLVEALAGYLLEHTMLPSAGYTLVNPGGIFKDPNQMGAGEDQDEVDKVSFRHRVNTRENVDRWISNAFYDELDKDQKQRMHLQWHRKVVMMKEAARHGQWDEDPPEFNQFFHMAYGYTSLDEKEYRCIAEDQKRYYEVDETNQDSNLRELGAFAGNSNGSLYQLFGTILKRAWETSHYAPHWRCFILEDILLAAEALNIKHNFPVETRQTVHLLNGRTMSLTLQEIACFDPEFWELAVGHEYEGTDEDECTALLDISLLSHEALVAKAQENIQNHIKMAADLVEHMEEVIVYEKESIACNGDDWGDEEVSAWLLEFKIGKWDRETPTKIEQEAREEAPSHQERIKRKLESFAANDIPSFQPHSKPALIGDRLKFMNACQLTEWSFDTCPRRDIQLLSPSASLFLQQLIEDFGLGVAIQPFPVTHERLPMPALCGIVLGRNGSTMAQLRVEGQGDDNHDETSDQSDSDFLDSDSEEE